jgi:hypothetical protein
MFGFTKRDMAFKIEFLTPYIGVAPSGLTGATDDILAKTRERLTSPELPSFDLVLSAISEEALKWYKANHEKLGEEEEDEDPYAFLLASAERIRKVDFKGYSEEVWDYQCEGSGDPYGEYILQNHYTKGLSEDKGKELAAYTILEASKVDPSVGDQLQLVVFRKHAKPIEVGQEETEDIKSRVAPLSRAFAEAQISTVEQIVEHRRNINALWLKRFNFRLFLPDEKAVFQIMKPCRSEEEFTNNIAAMALLIDQMDVKEMSKSITGAQRGSINHLEGFLAQNLRSSSTEFISKFRDVVRLRSTKHPIHRADSEFLEVVINLSEEYPPKWSRLYLKALNIYAESLASLLQLLQQHDQ